MSTGTHDPRSGSHGDVARGERYYQQLLDEETRAVPVSLRATSVGPLEPTEIAPARYFDPEFHRLEVDRIWRRVWQMACREEQIPEVGDSVVYDIADDSLIVVRTAADEIRAFHNSCLHRGTQLRTKPGRVTAFRCPFHGFTYDLDGRLCEIPCAWDFPDIDTTARLPEARVGTWGGFVFVNLDPGCQSLAAYLGDLPKHFEPWPLEQRYKEAHVAKRLPCNWKVAQEAFMEAYHVVGTHPQLLPGIGDANSQYDAWDTFSRAITANMTPSPHLERVPGEQEQLDSLITRSEDAAPTFQVPEGMTARQILAQITRMQLQGAVPGIQDVSDAELADSFYYSVFPNFHPWGAYNKLVYRFRPWGNDAQQCVMEAIYLAPFRGRRPKPAPVHWLGDDEDWTRAPELGFLARVFNQDTANLGRIQRGLRGAAHTHVTFGQYQETKIRHFHALLERYLA